MLTDRKRERHKRLRSSFRSWLHQTKRECVRCGQTNYAALRIVDRETGAGAGVNGSRWWLTPEQRDEIMAHSEVLCATCQIKDRKGRDVA